MLTSALQWTASKGHINHLTSGKKVSPAILLAQNKSKLLSRCPLADVFWRSSRSWAFAGLTRWPQRSPSGLRKSNNKPEAKLCSGVSGWSALNFHMAACVGVDSREMQIKGFSLKQTKITQAFSPLQNGNSKLVWMKMTFDLCYLPGFELVGFMQSLHLSSVVLFLEAGNVSRLMRAHTLLDIENIYV